MKLTAKAKLFLSKTQKKSLLKTLVIANQARNYISEYAFDNQVFGQYDLHKKIYSDTRKKFNLSAQVVIRCIASVADSYKLNKKQKHVFKKYSAISYDNRILHWYTNKKTISIWSIDGRLKNIGYVCGKHNEKLLEFQQGESDLVYHNKEFYLFATCNINEPTPDDFNDVLGIDLGKIGRAHV